MQDLWFSINTVFPLLLMMAAGFAARRLQWLSESTTRQVNNCIFRLFLPLLICFNIMDTDVQNAIDGTTLVFAFAGTIGTFLVLFWLVPRFCKQRNACGVLIQGIARSNYAIFGIPLVLMMYPGQDTSVAALAVVVVVPIFNVMSTVALMIFGNETLDWKRIVKGVLLNPLILATALGFLFWQLHFQLPSLLDKPLRSLSSVTTPLSLMMLGAAVDFRKARANIRLLTIGVLGRLVLVPLVFLPLAVALGIRDVSLATLIAVFASPVAVSSYPMAQQMGGDENLAGAQVAFTTALSIVTVFLWVLVLKSLGFLG